MQLYFICCKQMFKADLQNIVQISMGDAKFCFQDNITR